MKTNTKYLLIISIVYLSIYLLFLDRIPISWVDESWEANSSYQVSLGNVPKYSIFPESRAESKIILQPRLSYTLLVALGFKLLGTDLVTGRAISVFCGLIALIFTYLLAELLFGKKIAVISSVLLVVSTTFFITSRTLRHDIIASSVAMITVYFLSSGLLKQNKWQIYLGGFSIGVGLWTHQINFGMALLPLILFPMIRGKTSLISRDFWLCIFYCFLGVLPYLIYIAAFGDYALLIRQYSEGRPAFNGLSGFYSSVAREFSRWSDWIRFPARIFIALSILLAISFSIYKKEAGDKIVTAVILLNIVFFSLIIYIKTSRYLIIFVPFFSILVARMTTELYEKSITRVKSLRTQKIISVIGLSIGILYFSNQLAGNLFIIYRSYRSNYSAFTQNISKYIPVGARVWGNMTFWLGLHNYPYRTQYSGGKDLDTFKPQYVILYDNDVWGGKTATTGKVVNNSKWLSLRTQMEKLSKERGTFIGKVDDDFYGNVKIFKINWNRE